MGELRAVFRAKGDSKVTLLAQERVSRAKKMLTPFVLRRRKDHVSTFEICFCLFSFADGDMFRSSKTFLRRVSG